jgi:sensor histidine kinase YesM
MNNTQHKNNYWGIQAIIWIICLLVYFTYGSIKWKSYEYAATVTLVSFGFYMVFIYGNSLWLMPKYFHKANIFLYVVYAMLFFIAVCLVRLFTEKLILFPIQKVFYNIGLPHIALVFITSLIAFLFGILLFIANNYIHLLKREELLKTEQVSNQLHLLKQQVQPHFLFNTLNNIYSLANAKSDNTKVAIAKLADMMRYFNEEAPKEKISLQKEIAFIQNYIALEQLRMLHPVQLNINFTKENIELPTMLLMPFVENLFKHGIDKTIKNNIATLTLIIENGKLKFTVINNIYEQKISGGFGLSNLQKRLSLLYDNNYLLTTNTKGNSFEAYMEIPII